MPQVRDQGGNVTTVSATQAKELVQTGFYQYVTTPTTTTKVPGDNTKTGTQPSYVQPDIGSDWWNYPQGIGSYGTAYVDYDDDGTPIYTASGELGDKTAQQKYDWTLSAEEEKQVEEYWQRMQNHQAGFWNIYYEEDPVTGQYVVDSNGERIETHREVLTTGHWAIENDGEDMGFSDRVIAGIALKYQESASNPEAPPTTQNRPVFDTTAGGSGSGYGGGGGPSYIMPMRSAVEDTVKAMLTALVGEASDTSIQQLADEYEAAHKKQWDVRTGGGDRDIDPNQVVLDKIRGRDDYKRIHELRPDGSDETRWISERRGRLEQLGVNAGDADEQAIWLAQTGTAIPDIATGQLQTGKGRKDISLFNSIQGAALQVARQI
jgi:hypothetical protein